MGFGWQCSPASPHLARGPSGTELQGPAPAGRCPDGTCQDQGSSSMHPPPSRFLQISRADRRCGGCCVLSMAELIYRQTNTHCYSERRFPSDSFPFFLITLPCGALCTLSWEIQ